MDTDDTLSWPDGVTRLDKNGTRARIDGGVFEYKMAGLVRARLHALRRRQQHLDLRFLLATNVEGVNPFDDIVLHLRWRNQDGERALTYFVQLKHKENVDDVVTVSSLTGNINNKNKHVNLRRYYQKFKYSLQNINKIPKETITPTQLLLRDWLQGEVRLVFLITQDVLLNEARCLSETDFPFEDIFFTRQGEVFSFGETNEAIWNMLDGSPDEDEYRTKFLNRLRIFSGQTQTYNLDSQVEEALEDVIEGPLERPRMFLSRYFEFLQKWWKDEKSECISTNSADIEDIVRQDLHDQLPSLRFQSRYQDQLAQRLTDCKVVYIVVREIPSKLRCSLLKSVLENSTSDGFAILTETAFKDYSMQVLESLCEKLCDELILSVDTIDDDIRSFVENILTKKPCKLRVISSDWKKVDYRWMASRMEECDAWSERWMLAHLEALEQRRFLTRKVSFQGRTMPLAALEQTWPFLRKTEHGALLKLLATGESIVLGECLPPRAPVYIPRTIKHIGETRTKIWSSIWQLRSDTDRFLLSGFPDSRYNSLRSSMSVWQECNLAWIPLTSNEQITEANKTKWNIWTRSEVPKHFEEEKGKNLHWLQYEGGTIRFMGIHGSTGNIVSHMDNSNIKCNNAIPSIHKDTLDLVHYDGVALLTSEPGMGKSTYMTRMAQDLKEVHSIQWVLLVRLSHGNMMEKMPDVVKTADVIDLLTDVAQPTSALQLATRNFIKDSLKRSGKISILLDGVDEVCPSHKSKVLRILEILMRDMKFDRLWVAARPVVEENLTQTMRCSPFHLTPFSYEEQLQYLIQRWCRDVSNTQNGRLQDRAARLLQNVNSETERDGRTLCAVPLYVHLLAEVYTCDDYVAHETENPSINNLMIIRKFLQETRKMYWAKSDVPMGKIKNQGWDIGSEHKFLQHHKSCAAYLLFTADMLESFYEKLKKEVHELINVFETEKTGIIMNVINKKPVFIHRMFAEFFAALWLSENFHSVVKLEEILFKDEFEEVRYFFDALLAEGHIIHEAAIAGKPKVLEVALRRVGQDVNMADRGGRQPLHLASLYCHQEAVRMLLNNGANINDPDHVLQWTPLRFADRMLILPSRTDAWREQKKRALLHVRIVVELLLAGAHLFDSPSVSEQKEVFIDAVLYDFVHMAGIFISSDSPLFVSHWKPIDYLHATVDYGKAYAFAMLVQLGFDVNAHHGPREGTALHVAAEAGMVHVCSFLLKQGASINRPDKNGDSPLLRAASKGLTSVCKLLLELGADVDRENDEESTALHEATRWGDMSTCVSLLEKGADANAKDRIGRTPLHHAAWWGYHELCIEFLNRHAAVNLRDLSGNSALDYASQRGHSSVYRVLLKSGADVTAMNELGESTSYLTKD